MALTRFFLSTSILLLPLLFIASADDYSYGSKPDIVNSNNGVGQNPALDLVTPDSGSVPKLTSQAVKPGYGDMPTQESDIGKPDKVHSVTTAPLNDNQIYSSKPDSDFVTPVLSSEPNLDSSKLDQEYSTKSTPVVVKPDNEYGPKQSLQEPSLSVPKLGNDNPGNEHIITTEKPLPIGIEGLVLCKSGSSYEPIKGAITKIVCSAVNQNGYDAKPFSCLADATDANGYYFKALPDFGIIDNWKITECKTYLESSPLDTCNVPTDVNNGITGALFSSFRILQDKKIKLYRVGPLIYTSKPSIANNY